MKISFFFILKLLRLYLIISLSIQNLVSREAKNLIDIMLDTDPVKRVTATQALRHPWIANKEKIAQSVHRQVMIWFCIKIFIKILKCFI